MASYFVPMLLGFLAPILLANGWSGVGGDTHLIRDNIWFLGDDAVPYCVDVDAQYPLTQQEAEQMVAKAFRDWKAFFRKYQLDTAQLGELEVGDKLLAFPDRERRGLSLNFIQQDCQAPWPGIRFMFGLKDTNIQSYLESTDAHTLGVALRKNYDHETYRNPGYVWIQSFTADKAKIYHILLHELGHVFGMPHDSVFVMDEDIAYELKQAGPVAAGYFGKIESPAWKYRLRPGDKAEITSHGLGPRATSCRTGRPNRALPQELRSALRLPPAGCHRMTIKVGAISRAIRGQWFEVEIHSDRGLNQSMRGQFVHSKVKKAEQPSPGLVTRWQWFDVGSTTPHRFLRMKRVPLDPQHRSLPARGELVIGTKRFPARLSHSKGTVLELYMPHSKVWWVAKSSHNRF